MADDDKKAPENPKGRDKASEGRVKQQLSQSENLSKRQEKKQDILAKKAEILNKITQASATASDAKDKNNKDIFTNIETILDNNNVGSKVYLDQLEQLEKLESSLDAQIATGEKAIENDSVVRSLEDLVEENKRTTKLLEADSTAQLELRKQINDLNNGFYSGEFFNDPEADARAQGLKDAYDKASADLQDAIEAGNTQAQDLAMKQLEQIKESAESEENQREARKMNQLANDRLYQIADATEKTADGIGDAISGALATAGVLAGLAGLALLFLSPETFQAIVESIIDQVSGVIEFIEGILTGDFEMAFRGLGDSWMLLTGVFLALLPKIISIVSRVVKAVKVFRVFMLGSFIPGMIGMFTGMITAITPILAALSPILLPILAIAAIFGVIYL